MPLSNLSIVSKKLLVTRIICFFWLMAKVMSYKLWLADRLFPIVPPFNFLFVPSAIHFILFVFSLASIFALLIFPSNRPLQLTVIIIEVLSCLLDQNRWQPWEYEYIFIILALFINCKKAENAASSICFIFVCVYIFSGIGKINPVFVRDVHERIIHSGIIRAYNSYFCNFLAFHIGYLPGIIEIFLGAGLLFRNTKKVAALLLIIMHAAIVALFGPWAINYDIIILPWNMAFLLILYIFFTGNYPVKINFSILKQKWNMLFILFFALLPVLNFFGYWDFFLSSSLFSYRPPNMYVLIHKEGGSEILQPFSITKTKFIGDSNSISLNIRNWAFMEMNVPAYPEVRVYEKIKSQLVHRYPGMVADFIIDTYVDGKIVRTTLK